MIPSHISQELLYSYRVQRCLDKQLTNGGEVDRLTHQPISTPPQTFLYFCFWYTFLLGTEYIPGPIATGSIRKLIKIIDLIRSQTRDLEVLIDKYRKIISNNR
jgi:hypothetical protein